MTRNVNDPSAIQSDYYGRFHSKIRAMTNGEPDLETAYVLDRCQREAEEETKQCYAHIPDGLFHNHRLSIGGTSWNVKSL